MTTDGAADLERLIRLEHGSDPPLVDASIFGTPDPARIADALDRFCRSALGAAIAGARFYAVSVGCVAGVDLDDGRSVVVKVQRGSADPRHLEATIEVRRHLVERGFPCPAPIGGPTRLGEAWATIERFDGRGARADAHRPEVRRAIAASLGELVALARPFANHPALGGAWFTSIPDGRVFPRPHSPIFDFEATRHGAEWIEALAERARAHRGVARGERVVGHFDWRVEHLRFEDGRVVASFDWDSLHAELETVMVGAAAHAFTADWQRRDIDPVPTVDELRGFVGDYEQARGRPFTIEERATVAASCVYSLAYTARCAHALSPNEPFAGGDFRPLLREHGEALLALGLSPGA